jgi:superfamily II DNA or RNA helicase
MELIDYEGELDRLRCRDYQKNAVIATINAWENCRSTLIVLPTGMGKTHVGGSLCRIWEQHKDGRILWIAHRKELIEQAAGRIALLTGTQPEIEMADQRAEKHSLLASSSVVVASIQSLMAGRKCKTCDATGGILDVCPKCHGEGCGDSKCEGRGSVATDADCPFCLGGRIRRLQKFRPEEFSLIVYDECHHATSSTNRRVKKWFEQNERTKFLGLTATADRSDGAALGQVFQTVAINIELPYAIDNGWLVPIVQKSITCEHLDFSNVRTTAGDLNGRDLEDILANEETLHEMVAPTVELAGDRRTLIFCVDKTHTKLVCELINRYKKESANYILGDTKDEEREQLIAQHKAGKFQFMVGCGVFTEGYDDPGIQVVAIMRPTKSRALYVQMCGRGTRPIDPPLEETAEERKATIAASSKTGLLILDYVGNAGRHKLITALNLFDGEYSADILDRAKRIAEETDEELPTEELIRRAQQQADEEEQKRKELEEARRREWMKAREVKYKEQVIDPFGWWDTLPQRIGAAKQGRPASEKQISALLRMGVEPLRLDDLGFSAASAMMETLVNRSKKGLCTYKQSKVMTKNGINPDVSFETARKVMDALARNNWKCSDQIRAIAHPQLQEAGNGVPSAEN